MAILWLYHTALPLETPPSSYLGGGLSVSFLGLIWPCHMHRPPLKPRPHQRQGDPAAKVCIVSTFTFSFKTMGIWEWVRFQFGRCVSLEVTQEKTAGSPSWSGWVFFFMLCIQMREGRITGDCQTLAWKMTPFSETVVLDSLDKKNKLCIWVGERSNRTAEKFIHVWVFHYRG